MPIRFLLLFSCLLFFEKINAQTLVRGPYMHMATPNSIIIRWRTNIASDSQVKFGIDKNNLNNAFNIATPVTEHIFQLNNLLPDTKYYYSIGTSLITFQGDSQNYFRTAPITAIEYDKPIRVWAMGDMAKQTLQEIAVKNAFKKYTDTNYVDGFLMLGDNAYNNGYDYEYQNGFFNYFQTDITKHIVLWPCVGNHDYANSYTFRTNHQIPYLDIFSNPKLGEMGGVASNTERYYSFNYGNIHFINLDTYGLENVSGNYYGITDTAFSLQYQWLKQDLSLNTLPWVIVSFHHPPYCMGTHNSDIEGDLALIRTNLNPILEKYNVDLVLSGHCHTYQRSNLLKNHFGFEPSYDSTIHQVQNTNGKYDGTPNSCMYIKNNISKKDSGVIYAVVGSGSAIPSTPHLAWPHNAMVYSNYQDNGSMLITVTGNELKAVWISTDTTQPIKDQFFILKKSNLIKNIYCHYPSLVKLKASWQHGNYQWSTGDTSDVINFYATQDTIIIVHDILNCISDTFQIKDSASLLNTAYVQTLKINLYPNPVNNELNITLPEYGRYFLTIYDLTGKPLIEKEISAHFLNHKIKLKEKLSNGVYLIAIKNMENKYYVSKLTISN